MSAHRPARTRPHAPYTGLVVAVDFDGTLAEHLYPEIGQEVPGAFLVCRALTTLGVRIVLYTMRSGAELAQAVAWVEARGLKLWAVNANPEQAGWTTSPKVYAHAYIDDAAAGCPLVTLPGTQRPVVDWVALTGPLEAQLSRAAGVAAGAPTRWLKQLAGFC